MTSVAKSLLFNVLNDTIGKYIDGLTKENLQLSVLKGTITLNDVSLNRNAIEKLKLPVDVVNGHVESINIEIPWMSLEKSPVKIFINGVYLLMKPLHFKNFTQEQAQEHFKLKKFAALDSEESRIDLLAQVEDSAEDVEVSSGYVENLTKKIINNLEISVENVHLRCEDSISLPSSCFAVGFTLKSFVFTTTDSEWNRKFDNDVTAEYKPRYKLGKICNFGLYWASNASPHEEQASAAWIQRMKSYIDEDTERQSFPLRHSDYILQPPNVLLAKCIHCSKSKNVSPMLDVTLESIAMSFHLDRVQYHQCLHALDAMSENDRQLTAARYRPFTRPGQDGNRNVTKAWWWYALILVVNKEDIFERKVKIALDCCRNRSQYMALLSQEKRAIAASNGMKQFSNIPPLSPMQEQLKQDIELLLPLCALVVFRQLVSKAYYAELREEKDQKKKKEKSSSWFGKWWKKESPKSTAKAPLTKNPLTETIAVDERVSDPKQQDYNFDFSLKSNEVSLSITSKSREVCEISVGCISHITYSPKGDLACSLNLMSLTVKDEISPQPLFPYLISSADTKLSTISKFNFSDSLANSKTSPLSISYSSKQSPKLNSLEVTALPLTLCWNPVCLSQLLSTMMTSPLKHELPPSEQMMLISRAEIREKYQTYRAAALSKKRKEWILLQKQDRKSIQPLTDSSRSIPESLIIVVDLAAPVLIIPENSGIDMGCLMVNFGHFSSHGRILMANGDDESVVDHHHLSSNKISVGGSDQASDCENMLDLESSYRDALTNVNTKIEDLSVSFLSSVADVARFRTHPAHGTKDATGMGEAKETYIIQPFGIFVDLFVASSKLSSSELAETTVDIRIMPKFEVSLTARTYCRLLNIIDILQKTVDMHTGQVSIDENTKSSSMAKAAVSAMVEVNDTILCDSGNDENYSEENAVHSSSKQEFVNKLSILVQFSLPELSSILIYDAKSGNEFKVSLGNISFCFKDCLYDSSVKLKMGSFCVSDSMRPAEHRYLIRDCVALGDNMADLDSMQHSNELLQLSVVTFKSKKSPSFLKYGNEVILRVGRLSVCSDELTFTNLRPFYEVFLGKHLIEYPALSLLPPGDIPLNHDHHMTGKDNVSPCEATGSSVSNIPAGIQVLMSLNKFTLEFLKLDTEVTNNKPILESVSKLDMIGLSATILMESERTSDHEKYLQVSGSDEVVRGSTAELSANLKMRSLVIFDTRPMCEANYYTRMLGPQCGHKPSATVNTWELRGDEDLISIELLQEIVFVFHRKDDREKSFSSHHKYDEEITQTTVDIKAVTASLDVYISLDAIMELLNAAGNNLSALDEFMTPLSDFDHSRELSVDGVYIGHKDTNEVVDDALADSDESSNEATTWRLIPEKGRLIKRKRAVTIYSGKIIVPGQRLVFLDDPSSASSKAVMCQTGLEADASTNQSRVTDIVMIEDLESAFFRETEEDNELNSNLEANVILKQCEVLVLLDMAAWNPYHILNPHDTKLIYKTCEKQSANEKTGDDRANTDGSANINSVTHVNLQIGRIDVRMSLNDLLLIQNIMLQRTLVESNTLPPGSDEIDARKPNLSHFDVSIESQRISVILVQDFDPLNMRPLFRCQMFKFSLSASGFPYAASGKGFRGGIEVSVQVDSYNSDVVAWEPFIEPWNPVFTFVTLLNSFDCVISTEHTFQLTLTSRLLEELSRTLAVLQDPTELSEESSLMNYVKSARDRNKSISEIRNSDSVFIQQSSALYLTVVNKLGVDVEICCQGRNECADSVWHLSTDSPTCCIYPKENDSVQNDNSDLTTGTECMSVFDCLNVKIISGVSCPKEPLCNLETSRSVCRVYRLWDAKGEICKSDELDNTVYLYKDNAEDRIVSYDEEVFEYQRYVIGFGRSWKAPYLATDPHNWSSKRGKGKTTKSSIALPKDGLWEWQGDWRIDMSGTIGKSIDKEGWEYAFDFPELYARRHTNRRCMNKTDCVRRRRWLRTRISICDSETNNTSGNDKVALNSREPLFVCWDVSVASSGCRTATLRSCLQVSNQLPFSVMVRLGDVNGKTSDGHVFGPVPPENVLDIPLLEFNLSNSTLSFRPCDLSLPTSEYGTWDWSETILIERRVEDGCLALDLQSNRLGSKLPFCVFAEQKGWHRKWTLASYVKIFNSLPSNLDAKFLLSRLDQTSTSSRHMSEVEVVSLLPGEEQSMKHIYLPPAESCVFVSVHVPGLGWSEPHELPKRSVDVVNPHDTKEKLLELYFRKGDEVLLVLYGRYCQYSSQASAINIFSKNVVVDYSGLPLHLSYRISTRRSDIGNKRISLNLQCTEQGLSKPSPAVNVPNSLLSHCEAVNEFNVRSRHQYVIQLANEGSDVYCDHLQVADRVIFPRYIFVTLPQFLRNQLCVHTSYGDRHQHLQNKCWMSFCVVEDSFVCVLLDKRLETSFPKWVKKNGFVKTYDKAVAQLRKNHFASEVDNTDCDYEIFYDVYCKACAANENVELGTNYVPSFQNYQMYSAFVVPAKERSSINSRIWEQVGTLDEYDRRTVSDRGWATEGNGMGFLSDVNKSELKVGVSSTTAPQIAWGNKSLNIQGAALGKITFSVNDPNDKILYHLACKSRSLPGVFGHTNEFAIFPHYCLVNTTSSPLIFRQTSTTGGESSKTVVVDAYGTRGWHRFDSNLGTNVQVQTEGSVWSSGSIDINDIGSTSIVVYLEGSSCFVVLNVEVQLAKPDDKCAVAVVVWRSNFGGNTTHCGSSNPSIPVAVASSSMDFFSPLTVLNDSHASILVQQCSPSEHLSDEQRDERCSLLLPPFSSASYGWLHPEKPQRLLSFQLITNDDICLERNAGHFEQTRPLTRRKSRRRKVNLKGARKVLGKNNKAKKSPTIAERNTCTHVMLDISKIDASGRGELYYVLQLPDSSHSVTIDIVLKVEWSSGGKLVRILNREDDDVACSAMRSGVREGALLEDVEAKYASDNRNVTTSALSFSINFKTVGISLVVDTPYENCRHEMICAHFQEVHFEQKGFVCNFLGEAGGSTSLNNFMLSLGDLQVDNYSETVVFPVLFYRDFSTPPGADDLNSVDVFGVPFLRVCWMLESSTSSEGMVGQSCYRYVSANLMPFYVAIDSGTLQLFCEDFLFKLKLLSKEEALCDSTPSNWMKIYNQSLEYPWQRQSSLLDVVEAKNYCLQSKSLFEKLKIHPIKLYVTLVKKDLPKARQKSRFSWSITLEWISALGEVDLLEVKLRSFIVSNAIESYDSLCDRVTAKLMSDCYSQISNIIGSFALIGSPANLVRNIGDGVSDLIYEPIAGMKDSPAGFVKGLGKGTSSLMGRMVSGTLSSTASILKSTGSGISYLSGDADYVAHRDRKRLKQKAYRGGVLTGLKDGGGSVVSGFASGVSGIFVKPIAGAKKEGAGGFFKGIGQGLAGAVVKPVLGVSDGLSNVMQGVSNEVSGDSKSASKGSQQIRPRRTFQFSTVYPEKQILTELSVPAAVAQEILRTITREKMGGSKDTFLRQLSLSEQATELLEGDVDFDQIIEERLTEDQISDDSKSSKVEIELGQLILSERCLYQLKHDDYRKRNCSHRSILKEIKWYCIWEQVQRIDVITTSDKSSPQNCLLLHLQGGDHCIYCSSKDVAKHAYETLLILRHRIQHNRNNVDAKFSQSNEGDWVQLVEID